jgi:hypothetical protein
VDMSSLAWLAGLYEGEGCCTLQGKSYSVRIAMTDEDVVLRARDVAGVGTVYGPYDRGEGNKPIWTWDCNETASYAVLVALWPWLGVRRKADATRAIEHFGARERRFLVTTEQRAAICKDRRETGASQWNLAARHGVSRSLVQQILSEDLSEHRHQTTLMEGGRHMVSCACGWFSWDVFTSRRAAIREHQQHRRSIDPWVGLRRWAEDPQ